MQVVDKSAVAASASVRDAVEAAERDLGGTGRVLLGRRAPSSWSGSMVEAPTAEQAEATAFRLAEVVAAAR